MARSQRPSSKRWDVSNVCPKLAESGPGLTNIGRLWPKLYDAGVNIGPYVGKAGLALAKHTQHRRSMVIIEAWLSLLHDS